MRCDTRSMCVISFYLLSLPLLFSSLSLSLPRYPSAEAANRSRLAASGRARAAAQPPVTLLYALAILLQLEWSCTGKYFTKNHKALDEALALAERCW